MENKYSSDTQEEINSVLNAIKEWENIFSFDTEYYYDGWAIFLKEKCTIPRHIIIFKSYDKDNYSIKSFEIRLNDHNKEVRTELFSKLNIESFELLIKNLREIIYGKDLINFASKVFKENFLT